MPQVYIDASSAILLYRSDLFIPFAEVFSLVMAEAVFREITVDGYPGSSFFKTLKDRNLAAIQRPVPGKSQYKGFDQMDRGEQETLALFLKISPSSDSSFIIIDDGKGAKFCLNQGIPFINALLVPKIFWYSGRMNKQAYTEKTARIIELGRYAGKIIETAQALTEKDLKHFLPEGHRSGGGHDR